MIICLKGIPEECFSFNGNVNTSRSFLEHLEGSQRAIKGYLGTQRTLRHLDTQILRTARNLGTWALRHLGTQALGQTGTRALRALG